ncbi:glutaminase [Thalassospira marina]|uniref:Glutaminase n=1 Tax=Thalassospira marina TaxID=2048283 RepID=A0A2N3KS00_9PROT|nr:glutaminase [Thalassospira marina]PKR53331.1 glutaminase [Thalassospira marina]
MPADYASILADIAERVKQRDFQTARNADYIPALAAVPGDRFAMVIRDVNGAEYSTGDADIPFSIQSVSKVFALVLALRSCGEELWQAVRREPSGSAFNSLILLEQEEGIPRNPFINAGAIRVCDMISSRFANPDRSVAEFLGRLSSNPDIRADNDVYLSEDQHGNRNRAIAYLMKSFEKLDNPVEAVVRTYFKQCAIAMSAREMARATLFLANQGIGIDGNMVLSPAETRRINALMLTCGMYDGVGDFAFSVGIPAKSGVGGAIIGVIPGEFSVCVWSPRLDARGNSAAGIAALEMLIEAIGRSVF